MNILILTPDRVGSTLLQRVVTLYMNSMQLDENVINLHELSNGLEYYYSDIFNDYVLGKPGNGVGGAGAGEWGYYQSLPEIVELLNKVTHYKTSRLAHYHLVRRKDSILDQTNFYNYLNDNFYIIACQRENVFEHALSWGINAATNTLNVYTHNEKINLYSQMYNDKITIPKESFIVYLEAYRDYIQWTATYFNVNSFFVYEKHMNDIEQYISTLDIFSNTDISGWNDMFGMSWKDWNKCHRLLSDLSFGSTMKYLENQSDSKLPLVQQVSNSLPLAEQKFLNDNGMLYIKSTMRINELVDNKILVSSVPIKLQTLAEKKMLIKNFAECLQWYNEWANVNGYPMAEPSEIVNDAIKELEYWYENVPTKLKMLANS